MAAGTKLPVNAARPWDLSGHRTGSYLTGAPRRWKTGYREIQTLEFDGMRSCRLQLHPTGPDYGGMGIVGIYGGLSGGHRPMNETRCASTPCDLELKKRPFVGGVLEIGPTNSKGQSIPAKKESI